MVLSPQRILTSTVITRSNHIIMPSHHIDIVPSFAQSRAATTPSNLFMSSGAGMPEPDSCPECSDVNGYWDGGTLFVCTACAHEWPIDTTGSDTGTDQDDDSSNADTTAVRDSNGVELQTGDSAMLIKDLAKGKLKKGLKVKLRVGDYGDDHDCEATIKTVGTYALKSEFLKKV